MVHRFFLTIDMLTSRRLAARDALDDLQSRFKRVRGMTIVSALEVEPSDEQSTLERPSAARFTIDDIARALFVANRVTWPNNRIPTYDALAEHEKEVFRRRARDVSEALRTGLRSHPDTETLRSRGYVVVNSSS